MQNAFPSLMELLAQIQILDLLTQKVLRRCMGCSHCFFAITCFLLSWTYLFMNFIFNELTLQVLNSCV
jgi:hypothetical protein